jgi:hypothetical protein
MTLQLKQAVLVTPDAPVKVVQQVVAANATFILTNGSASNKVYIGLGSGVTVNNGVVIPPYGILVLSEINDPNPIYAVAHTLDAGGIITIGVFYGDNATTTTH